MNFPEICLDNVRAVFIDIDNTLYNYNSAHDKAIKLLFEYYKDQEWYAEVEGSFYNVYRQNRTIITDELKPQAACRSRFLAFQRMLEALNVESAYVYAKDLDEKYWQYLIENMEPLSAAIAFLKRCQSLTIPVCAVTDMLAMTQVEKLKALGVDSLIKFMVTSEEVGAEKPSPKMFEAALNKVKVNSSDVIMIGDDLNKDIKGAEALGIRSYQVKL